MKDGGGIQASKARLVAESGENWVGTQFARLIEVFYELYEIQYPMSEQIL